MEEKKLLNQFGRLSPAEQQQVLRLTKRLAENRPSGRALLRFAGSIDADDLSAMSHAIEEGCERVDPDAW